MNNMGRNIIIWLVFGAALLALFNLFQSPSSTSPASQVAYSDFIAEVNRRSETGVKDFALCQNVVFM